MKKIFMILAFATSIHFSMAAINFSVIGSKVRTFYIDANALEDCIIPFKNNLTSNISLQYAKLELDYPVIWGRSFCDNVSCFPDFQEDGNFLAFSSTENASFKISVAPNGKADTGTVKYVIWDKNNPQDRDTVEWHIYVRWSAAVSQLKLSTIANSYPNPCTTFITVDAKSASTLSIMDQQGRNVLEISIREGKNKIDLTALKAGYYIIGIRNERYFQTEKLLKQ